MQALWYFDFISPFAWLQLPRILALTERVDIRPVPILFAGVLDRLGQLGPAEIPAKRVFTYRFVQWQAQCLGLPLRFPPAHPFNPLPALRLCIAAGAQWPAVEAIFAHLWQHGRAGDSVETLAELAQTLGIVDLATAVGQAPVKDALRDNTEHALANGVFGVPTLQLGEELFWGNDATAMAVRQLDEPGWLQSGEFARIAQLPSAIQRRR